VAHATEVRAEARGVLAETRALIKSRLGFANDQLDEIAALQGRNQKLIETLAKKATAERGRIEGARAMLTGMKAAHERNAEALDELLDPEAARASGMRARAGVASSTFTRGIGEVLDGFFRESRDKIRQAIEVIDEQRRLMANVSRKMTHEYKIATIETAQFATERFLVELDRIEEHCAREFKGGSGFILKSRGALGTLFFDTVALQVVHIFEIADRETRAWMGGFLRPLEAQINAFQEQSYSRIEGMGRIQTAEGDLLAKLEELRHLADHMAAQEEQHRAHEERIMGLLEVERTASLA